MKKFLNSINSTKSNNEIEILFRIDTDDKKSINYFNSRSNEKIKAVIGSRNYFLAENYNEILKISKGNIIMVAADDIEFTTPKWNDIVERKFLTYPDQILIAHGSDGISLPYPFGSHPFVSRKITEILGYVAFPLLNRYIDTWINKIGNMLHRNFVLPIETIHWTKKTGYSDIGLVELENKREVDQIIFKFLSKHNFFDLECNKIRKEMKKRISVI